MAAYELHVKDAPPEAKVKVRSPIITAVLIVVTIFVYAFVWYYKINRELRDYGQARGRDLGQSPGTSLLAVTLGALVIVPALVSIYNTNKRIQQAQRLSGIDQGLNGWISLVLYLVFAPAEFAYMQSELNKVWEREAEAIPGQDVPPGFGEGASAGLPPVMPGSAPATPPATGAPPPPATDAPPPGGTSV